VPACFYNGAKRYRVNIVLQYSFSAGIYERISKPRHIKSHKTFHVLFIMQHVEVERTIKRIRVNFNLLKLLVSFW